MQKSDASDGGGTRFVINSVDEDTVFYTFNELPDQSPVGMPRERFEAYLDKGSFAVVGEDISAEKADNDFSDLIPVETTFYHNGRQYLVDRVNAEIGTVNYQNIDLMMPNDEWLFHTDTIEAVRGYMRDEPQEPPKDYVTEKVAEYPAEETHLPYDIVIETLKTPEPEPPTVTAELTDTVQPENFKITDER